MKAVILSEGPSAAEYIPGAIGAKMVVGVNTSYFTYHDKTGEYPDLTHCMCQDKPSIFNRVKPRIFGIPDDIVFINNTAAAGQWQARFPGRKAVDFEQAQGLHRYRETVIKKHSTYGNLTCFSAMLYAYRKGASEIHVYGHDLHDYHPDPAVLKNIINTAVREINFLHEVMVGEGKPGVFLHEASTLWAFGVACNKIEKTEVAGSGNEEAQEELQEEAKPKRARKKKEEQ